MPDTTGKKILIVDDTKLGRLSVKKKLARLGLNEVLECDNGMDVPGLLKNEEISLVLMDILMPEQNGIETLKEIRKKDSEIPIVMITADIQKSTRKICQELGANGFISKPVQEETLKEVLKDISYL